MFVFLYSHKNSLADTCTCPELYEEDLTHVFSAMMFGVGLRFMDFVNTSCPWILKVSTWIDTSCMNVLEYKFDWKHFYINLCNQELLHFLKSHGICFSTFGRSFIIWHIKGKKLLKNLYLQHIKILCYNFSS